MIINSIVNLHGDFVLSLSPNRKHPPILLLTSTILYEQEELYYFEQLKIEKKLRRILMFSLILLINERM